MIRSWVKILPYFIVKRIVQWLECTYIVAPKERLYLWVIDEGEYLLFSEKKYKEMKKKKENKRKKKLEKARKKLYAILKEFPELRDELFGGEK